MRLHLTPWRVVPVLVAVGLILGAGLPTASAQAGGSTAFGSTVQLRNNETWPAGIARIERVDGHLDVVRIFQNVPDPDILGPLAGRTGIISFRMPPGDVLSGRYDRALRLFFAAAPRTHVTVWSYYHEADVAYSQGHLHDLGQFRAASTHVALLARAARNPQLRNAVVLVDWTANPRSPLTVAQFMPRADLVDVVAWDDYNGNFTQDGRYGDPIDQIRLNRQAAAQVGKPWAVAEFGSVVVHHDTQGRAAWISRFAREAEAQGARFVSYYDSNEYGHGADYRLLDPPSQHAYHAIVSSQRG